MNTVKKKKSTVKKPGGAAKKAVQKKPDNEVDLDMNQFFSMQIPEWFVPLSVNEKKKIIYKLTHETINRHVLTREELEGLITSAR